MTTSDLKYVQVAGIVREMVTDGTLKPGQAAPSGAQLSRLTGFSVLTCRKALQVLVREGVLVRGPSPGARPRVEVRGGRSAGQAANTLARGLAARRHARGLTQPDLSVLTGFSITTIGHAETGRLWQSRAFWEKADLALSAGGDLVQLYDAYRAGITAPAPAGAPERRAALPSPAAPVVSRVTLHWSDGSTTSYRPQSPLTPARRQT